MIKVSFLLLVTLALAFSEQECGSVAKGTLNWTINHGKNRTGHWVTTASAILDSSNSNNEMDMKITRTVTDCGGGRYLTHIQGVLGGDPQGGVSKILFHPRHGRNIVLQNNRSTAVRMREDLDQGVVYTDRILRRNEMFEVRLDKVNNRYPHNLGIGVTTHTPYERNLPDENFHVVSGTWIHYHTHVWINKVLELKKYGEDLDNSDIFKVGDRVGVLVTNEGILHFYFNGVDLGPADSNIPDSVYGVIVLRSKAVQVTITDHSLP